MTTLMKTLLLATIVSTVAIAAHAEGYRTNTGTNSQTNQTNQMNQTNQTTGNAQTQARGAQQQTGVQQYSNLSSNDIATVQESLNSQGYNLTVDGIWGQQTSDAIRAFQRTNNLTETGRLDSETVAELDVELSSGVNR